MIEKRNNYILSIDLLGFENWVKHSNIEEVRNEYSSIITGVSYAAEIFENNDYDFFVYSDTLVLIFNGINEDKNITNLLKCARIIQHGQLYRSIGQFSSLRAIRGTITYGEFIYHKGDISTKADLREKITAKNIDIFIGKPIIEGYHLEKEFQLMSIILADSCLMKISSILMKKLIFERLLIKYEIPYKTKGKCLGYVSAPLCDFTTYHLIINKMIELKNSFEKNSDIFEKYDNTIKLLEFQKQVHDPFLKQ